MRSKPMLLLALLMVGLSLAGCVRSELEPLAVVTLVNEADDLLMDYVDTGQWVSFDDGYEEEGVRTPDRFPEWARSEYDACVYWTDGFRMSNRSGGVAAKGRAWGWILIDRELNYHILEVAYEDEETGETHTLRSAWAEPMEEE